MRARDCRDLRARSLADDLDGCSATQRATLPFFSRGLASSSSPALLGANAPLRIAIFVAFTLRLPPAPACSSESLFVASSGVIELFRGFGPFMSRSGCPFFRSPCSAAGLADGTFAYVTSSW